MNIPVQILVEESSQVSQARRYATALCDDMGFGDTLIGEVELVTTELATNLVKHTRGAGGGIVLSPIQMGGANGIDILSLDKGPGISNITESLRDGYSTSGSLGTGMGAVRRLSFEFDIYSVSGQGTAVFSRIWQGMAAGHPVPASPALAVGAVCLPLQGEQDCGDGWAMHTSPSSTLFLLVDGLGHGTDAAIAASAAVTLFKQGAPKTPAEMIEHIHAGLRHTRGAVVAVAEVMPEQGIIKYAGVGNISGSVFLGENTHRMISYNGTAGIEVRKIREIDYPWQASGLLVLHTDGLDTHWALDNYPGLAQKHPALIAGVLFRDHQRLRDDSCVLVAKVQTGEDQ